MTISPRRPHSLPATLRHLLTVMAAPVSARISQSHGAPRLEDVLPGRDHGEREADPEAGDGHQVPFSVTRTRPIDA